MLTTTMGAPLVRIRSDTLYGTLSLLILQCVAEGERHGLEIRNRIKQASADALRVDEGALYPALHRLQREGLVQSEWRVSEKKRRAKYYSLTAKGQKHLEREEKRWRAHVEAVGHVLGGERAS